MGLFDVDYNALVVQVLPVRWRNPVMIAWCKILVSKVVYLKGEFDANRAANLYNLAHNGQVCKLSAALNDTFDSALRRIYISNPGFEDPIYFPLDSEVDSLHPAIYFPLDSEVGTGGIAPIYFPLDSEVTSGSGASFIVNVPSALTFSMAQMEALINELMLPGRTYSIVTF